MITTIPLQLSGKNDTSYHPFMCGERDPFCYTLSCGRCLAKHEKLRGLWCLRYVHAQVPAEDAGGAPHRGTRDQTRRLVSPQWGHQPSEAVWEGSRPLFFLSRHRHARNLHLDGAQVIPAGEVQGLPVIATKGQVGRGRRPVHDATQLFATRVHDP